MLNKIIRSPTYYTDFPIRTSILSRNPHLTVSMKYFSYKTIRTDSLHNPNSSCRLVRAVCTSKFFEFAYATNFLESRHVDSRMNLSRPHQMSTSLHTHTHTYIHTYTQTKIHEQTHYRQAPLLQDIRNARHVSHVHSTLEYIFARSPHFGETDWRRRKSERCAKFSKHDRERITMLFINAVHQAVI